MTTPIEVHLNTRGCEPMQPETAAALARVFKAAYDQLSREPMPSLYTPPDVLEANAAWGANCGPAALAAVLGKPLADVRHCFPGFPAKPWVTPTAMKAAIEQAGWRWSTTERRGDETAFAPRRGVAFIQWEGPWMDRGVPIRARYKYTHWVACSQPERRPMMIFDANVPEWLHIDDWQQTVVPRLLAGIPRATGWHVRDGIEVQFP